jgi:hypothetical protein
VGRFDDDRPKFEFKPRPRHLLYLVDLAVIAGLFLLGAYVFRTTAGEKKLAEGAHLRELAKASGSLLLAQADSVVAAAQGRLSRAEADSAASAADLSRRRADLVAAYQERERRNKLIYPLTDQVFDFRDRSTRETAKVVEYRKELAGRRSDIVDLTAQAEEAARRLAEAQGNDRRAQEQLAMSRRDRTYEPVGMFPDKSGVLVRRDVSEDQDLTNVELQHNVWKPGAMDLGVSLGFGLGSGNSASSKQLGLVLTRGLLHRRLGVDFGAGYSVLTNQAGSDAGGAYASASLRLSPFYKERFHFGLGARADKDNVLPFVSIGVGRR